MKIAARGLSLVLSGLTLIGGCILPIAAARAQDIITFGTSLSLTGALSTEAKGVKLGYDFYVKHINDLGGINVGGKKYKVAIKYYDDGSNTNTAVQLYERLINEDHIQLLLGPYGSGASLAVTAAVEQHRLPIVIAHGASTPIYTRGFKYTFGVLNTVDQYTLPIIKMVSEQKPPLKNVALLNEDALFAQLGIDGAASQAQQFGLNVVYKEKYPSGIKDLSAQLIKMKAANPDLIIAGGYTSDMILLAKQLHEIGLKPKLLAYLLGPTLPGFVSSLKQDAENTLEPTQWSPNSPWKDQFFGYTANDFAKMFETEFGYWPDYHPPQSAAALEVYQAALEKTGSLDPQKVRDAIAETNIMTFYGPIHFNAMGENIAKSMGVTQIQDGKPVVVYPPDAAEAKLRLN
jgi:branched-chain amino acid transport system substrate-binding protein